MAKRKPFKKIVITSKALLDEILIEYYDNHCGDADGFIQAMQVIVNPTPEEALNKWLRDNNVALCNYGRKQILAAAKTCSSWKEYFRTHWNEKATGWLYSESEAITNRTYLKFTCDHNVNLSSFTKFLRDNPQIKWGKWPFNKVKR